MKKVTLMETKESRLSKNPLFIGLPKNELVEIAQNAKDEVVSARQTVFQEGDPGNRFYIINSGKVLLFKKGGGGVEIPLAELGTGDFFGHVAILTEGLRWMNVEAEETTHLTIISKDKFEKILEKYPNVSLAFAKQMSKCLARDDVIIKKIPTRLQKVPGVSWLDFFAVFLLSLLGGLIFNYSNPNGINLIPRFMTDKTMASVTVSQALAYHSNGEALFIDARPSTLYQQSHIKEAVNIPLPLFDILYMMTISEIDKNKNIIVYGRTVSSLYDKQEARKFRFHGHTNVMILSGGLHAWKKKGYPVKP